MTAHKLIDSRSIVIAIMVVFIFVGLMGFSLSIDLRPAHALFGLWDIVFDPTVLAQLIAQMAWEKAWDFVKAMATAFVVQFIANMAMKLLQKLESVHIIKNMLYYSDALGYAEYIGAELNKSVLKPKNSSDVLTAPKDKNIGSIAADMLAKPFVNFSKSIVENIARSPQGGLNQQQEKLLMRGALALLVSQVNCGVNLSRAVRNVAIYEAAKSTGVSPTAVDPRDPNFYQYMVRFGNPLASADFQELMMRDFAASAESKGQTAAQQEMLSNGMKSLRSSDGTQLARSSQTIADFIGQSAGTLLQSGIGGAEAGFAAKLIGSTLANIVTAALFNTSGRLIAENPYCGITPVNLDYNVTSQPIDPGPGSTPPPSNNDPFAGAYITVSPQVIEPGQSVTLSWNAGAAATKAYINGSQVSISGSRQEGPLSQSTTYQLVAEDPTYGQTVVGVAVAVVQEPPPDTGGSTGTFTFAFVDGSSTATISAGSNINVYWQANGFTGNIQLVIRDQSGSTVYTSSSSSGNTSLSPSATATYTGTLENADTGLALGQRTVTITVN